MITSFKCKCGEWIFTDSKDIANIAKCEKCGGENKIPHPINFLCPKCSNEISVLEENGEDKVQCWYCGNISYVPFKTSKPRTKRCPTCFELIYKEAKKCRFCGDSFYNTHQYESFFKKVFSLLIFKRKNKNVEFKMVSVKKISPNPYQPREYIDKEELEKLKVSIKNFGIIVPLILRKVGEMYELVAGQRRLIAAKEINMKTVPAVIRNLSNKEVMEIGYLENLHRKGLKSIEEGRAIDRLNAEYPEMGYELIASKFGKDLTELRSNLKLTKLPIIIQEALGQGMITDEQARFLALIPDTARLIDAISKVYKNQLTFDQTINLVNEYRMKELDINPRSI